MIDDPDSTVIRADNIRSLMVDLAAEIDNRFARFRRGTRYESVRPSDVRVFVAATRGSLTISEIAGRLDVSRQAVHASVLRLAELKIVELQPKPNNGRDKIVAITARGEHARQTAVEQIIRLESEFADTIGGDELEILRKALGDLIAATRKRNSESAAQNP
jgi:DNA-binding MarR family transcriptional regulator